VARIEETELPGIGVREEFVTGSGTRIGVITTRTGKRDLLLYDAADPDECSAVIPLDGDDSATLAGLLGASRSELIDDAVQRLPGLTIEWVKVAPASPLAGRTIGESEVRSRTGAYIIAMQSRDSGAVPAPGPDAVVVAGSLVVVVGTPEAVERLQALLQPPNR
jgi:TrkA domain protein